MGARVFVRLAAALAVLGVAVLFGPVARAEGFGPEISWTTSTTACEGDACWIADANGDGLPDAIAAKVNGFFDTDFNVALGTRQGFDRSVEWVNLFGGSFTGFADVTGDGKADMVLYFDPDGVFVLPSTGSSFDLNTADQWFSGTIDGVIFLADVDGDEMSDLVAFDQSSADVYVYLSTGEGLTTGSGFDGPYLWHSNFAPSGEVPQVGDVNGDGKADILSFDGVEYVTVALSTGSAFGTATAWHENMPEADERTRLGDVNGDGKMDLVLFMETFQSSRSVYVAYSTGSAFDDLVYEHDDFCASSDACYSADLNGDGNWDLVSVITTTGGSYTAGEAYASLRQPCGVFDTQGTSCEDGLWCNGEEECTANHECVASSNPTDDGNACTTDSCTEPTPPATEGSVTHTPIDPDDSEQCTIDWCDPETGVHNDSVADGMPCTDGNVCNGLETCQFGRCETTQSFSYDDGNPCTNDICDSGTGIVTHAPVTNGTSCSDDDVCNGAEECQSGVCMPGTPPSPPVGKEQCWVCTDARGSPDWSTPAQSGASCDDANPCTSEQCDGSGNCSASNLPASTPCPNGDVCDGDEECDGSGACQAGTPVDADDGNVCTADSCDAVLGKQNIPIARGEVQGECDGDYECDGAGRCVLDEGSAPEPDVDTLDPAVATSMDDAASLIWEGENRIQSIGGASIDPPDPKRVAVLRGRLRGRDNCPEPPDPCFSGPGEELALPNVKVTIHGDQGRWGETLTRDDGYFDFVVDGGGPVTVSFERDGYLPAHRTAHVPWNDYVVLDDVVLIAVDPNSTSVDFSQQSAVEVVEGSIISEAGTTRQGTLVVPVDSAPEADGNPVQSLTIRITEYTAGSSGPRAMPGDLPPSSGYTYAVELSADGFEHVEFTGANKPVFYVENFLDLDLNNGAQTSVPAGYYDREDAAWKQAPKGMIVKIIDCDGPGGACGQGYSANVDTDGNGTADNNGIASWERSELAAKYDAGDELWRVVVEHFSPWDLNWPIVPPPCGSGGPCPDCEGCGPKPKPDPDCPEDENGSIIECDTQVLGETLPVAGTPYTLNYRSSRVPDHKESRTVKFRLPGGNNSGRLRFDVRLSVAGKIITDATYAASSYGQEFEVTWDGLDVYGRRPNGRVLARLVIDDVYTGSYVDGGEFAEFASEFTAIAGTQIGNGREEVTIRREFASELGGYDTGAAAVGGWTLTPVHWYDPFSRTLYRGDGTKRTADARGDRIERFAGTGTSGYSGDGSASALEAKLNLDSAFDKAAGIAVAPDGTVYFSDQSKLVRRVAPDGNIHLFAGDPTQGSGYSGDGGDAVDAQLKRPSGLAVGPDGSVYIADSDNHLVRRVAPDGKIYRVAGKLTGGVPDSGFSGDGGSPLDAELNTPTAVAVAPDGTLFIADSANRRVRKVTPASTENPNGIITTVAGNGGNTVPTCPVPDGLPATDSGTNLYLGVRDIALDAQGNLYIAGGSRLVRRLGPDGRLWLFAGDGCAVPGGQSGYGDGGPADDARLKNANGVATGRDGSVYIVDQGDARVRRVDPTGIIQTTAGTGASGSCTLADEGRLAASLPLSVTHRIAVDPAGALYVPQPSCKWVRRIVPLLPGGVVNGNISVVDGREKHVFDSAGRHTETRDAWTDAVVRTIGRTNGLVTSITEEDTEDVVTTITRVDGDVTRITSEYGQETLIDVDGSGWLESVTYPVDSDGDLSNDQVALSHTAGGLLTEMLDARGYNHVFVYDSLGRLIEDHDPAGGTQLLTRPAQQPADGYSVVYTDAEGRERSYELLSIDTGGKKRVVTEPDGTTRTTEWHADGSTVSTWPGVTIETTTGADPIHGIELPFAATETTTQGTLVRKVTRSRTTELDGQSNTVWKEMTIVDPDPGINAETKVELNLGTLVRTTTSPMNRTITEQLDSKGRVISVARPGIEPITFGYDDFGRLATITQDTRVQTLTYYDTGTGTKGYLKQIEDPAGNVTHLLPDALGRVLERTAAYGTAIEGTTELAWDASGNLVEVTPPGKPVHTMSYSPVNLLTAYTPPDLGTGSETTTYAQNLARQPATELRPDGMLLGYVYDSAGRVEEISQPGFGGVTSEYYGTSGLQQYEVAGALKKLSGPAGVDLTFKYQGWLPKELEWSGSAGVAGKVTWAYDDLFRVTSETVTVATTPYVAVFEYDNDGLVTCASPSDCDSATDKLVLAWDAEPSDKNGLLYEVTIGSGSNTIRERLAYNAFGELASQTVVKDPAGSPTTLMQIVYDTAQDPRDDLGRILKKTETLDGTTTTWTYTYDPAGRLDVVTKNSSDFADYKYDLNGNRTHIDESQSANATYDDQDRLLTYDNATFTYGLNGELRTKTVGSDVTTYHYDGFGNLRQVDLPDGKTIEYLVDGLGRRVGKKVDSVLETTWLYKDQLEPVAEIDVGSCDVTRFIYASRAHVPDLIVKPSGTYRVLVDQLGSVRMVVDISNGSVVQKIDYDPWGVVLGDTNEGFQPFGFAGGLLDYETALLRLGARDYNAAVGRWISKDPIRFLGGVNTYVYALGDPIDVFDLDGRQPTPGGEGGPGFGPPGNEGSGGAPGTAPPQCETPEGDKCREECDWTWGKCTQACGTLKGKNRLVCKIGCAIWWVGCNANCPD